MSKEHMDTYRVECNCGMCMSLRDSMGQSCRGCGMRHNEVIDLTAERDQLREENEDKSELLAQVGGQLDTYESQLKAAEDVFREIFELRKQHPDWHLQAIVGKMQGLAVIALNKLHPGKCDCGRKKHDGLDTCFKCATQGEWVLENAE